MTSGYTFDGVWFEPGGVPVLRGVDLELPCDGITAIVGPSGSGKSTLLRMGNRLEVPSRGRVLLDGVDVASLDPLALRRRAGMVFQHAARFDGSTADNLRVAAPDADQSRLEAALAQVGLDAPLLERSAAALSGGEAQRMCLARTLLTEPQILLMDEATSALDVDSKAAMEQLTKSLAASGIPVLWVTHDLDQAARMGERVVVVLAGRVATPEVAARCLDARSFDVVGGGDADE